MGWTHFRSGNSSLTTILHHLEELSYYTFGTSRIQKKTKEQREKKNRGQGKVFFFKKKSMVVSKWWFWGALYNDHAALVVHKSSLLHYKNSKYKVIR